MRLTRPGYLAVASVPALVAAAWLLGQPELSVAAALLGAALLAAVVVVLVRPARVQVRRTVVPPRVGVGEQCHVRLDVRNVGSVRTPVLALHDDAGDHGAASVHLAPVPVGGEQRTSYSLPTHRRGLHRVGPVTIRVEDPLGLLRRDVLIDDVQTVVVRPTIHPLTRLSAANGDVPEQGTRVLFASATVDEELAAMRPYVVGDDIRRIHWRTTARIGHPVVRQFDQPWQRRTTILLDVDEASTDPAAFERAVTLTASVVAASAEDGGIVRLVTSDGTDSGFVATSQHLDALLDQLAAISTETSASLGTGLTLLSRRPTGRIVTVLGRLTPAAALGWSRATRGYRVRVLAHTDATRPSPTGADAGGAGPIDPGAIVLHWDGNRPLTDVWAAAMGRAAHPHDPSPRGSRPVTIP
ncbi:MAG: DUF58 domain-containing protein [Actinobacteria bacterium]|nr:DUF58 domain-containing protein [Actinomycetota bacterium]